jgi:hypothetical protein
MGDSKATYQYKVSLLSESAIQIRHNALEAARVSANKVMFDKLGETGYLVKLVTYPHVILRENRMIATAGADRIGSIARKAASHPTSFSLARGTSRRKAERSWSLPAALRLAHGCGRQSPGANDRDAA